MGLKSASLMLLREFGPGESGFLESLGAVPGRLPRIGVPWGMLPAPRGEAGSPIGLAPGSLVAFVGLPGPLAPPGPRRLERGMPSGLAMGLLPLLVVGGALGVMLLSPNQPTVGASGAVFGLMGALVVLQVRAKQNPWRSGILGLVLVNVLFTFAVPGISVGGHLGGLLVGAVTGAVVPFRRVPEQGDALRHVVLAGLGVLCLVAAVLAARAALPDLVPTVQA